MVKGLGTAFSIIVPLVFASMPISIYMGWVGLIIINKIQSQDAQFKNSWRTVRKKWNDYKGHVNLVNPPINESLKSL